MQLVVRPATSGRIRQHVYLEAFVAPALDDKLLDAEIEGQQVRVAIREAQPGSADGNASGV
jgi:hypothetical protein